jgi:hypothetical protein
VQERHLYDIVRDHVEREGIIYWGLGA